MQHQWSLQKSAVLGAANILDSNSQVSGGGREDLSLKISHTPPPRGEGDFWERKTEREKSLHLFIYTVLAINQLYHICMCKLSVFVDFQTHSVFHIYLLKTLIMILSLQLQTCLCLYVRGCLRSAGCQAAFSHFTLHKSPGGTLGKQTHTQYIHTNENLRFYHRRCHKLGLASKSATHR